MTRHVTRRSVVRTAVGGVVATGLAGSVAAERTRRKVVGLTADAPMGVASDRAARVRRELDFEEVGKAVSGWFSERALADLAGHPAVRYVEDAGTISQASQVSQASQANPWGIDAVDADIARDYGETGAGVDVAILDGGIDDDHPDLQPNLGTGKDFTDVGHWDDLDGHGTHCAGIAAAVDNDRGVVGVAPDATLHAVKVLLDGEGKKEDLAAGMRWVADQGYDVASMSVRKMKGSDVRDAAQYAQNRGVLQVAGAGNDYRGAIDFPAAYPEIMAVGATDEGGSIADFSDRGPEMEIVAPGDDVVSTQKGGGTIPGPGTSQACPHVAGAAAILISNGLSPSQARSRLKNTAEDLGYASDLQGAGQLDVQAAVAASTGEHGPQIDDMSATESNGWDGDYVHVYWTVQDLDGNLDEVRTTVQGSEITESVSGDWASGTHVHGPFDYPYSYGAYVYAYDDAGNQAYDWETA